MAKDIKNSVQQIIYMLSSCTMSEAEEILAAATQKLAEIKNPPVTEKPDQPDPDKPPPGSGGGPLSR
jgi:hypothetical protein